MLDKSKLATDLMKSLGDKTYVSITRKGGGVVDPIEGTTTGESTEIIPAVGVVVSLASNLIDGTRIKATDKMILLDNGVTPTYSDLISFGGVDHTIVNIGESNHAGITQFWRVVCRG